MKNLSATTLSTLLRSAPKLDDGSVDIEATVELVRASLALGSRQKPSAEDFDAVRGAVEACFDLIPVGGAIQRKVLLLAAELASPEHAERCLTEVLKLDAYKGVQKVGFRRVADMPASA